MDRLRKIRELLPALLGQTILLAGGSLLLSCSMTPPAPSQELSVQSKHSQHETETKQIANPAEPSLPLSPEVMYYILTAEIAGQRGDVALAAELYAMADKKVASPALAARTAQVANYTRDKQRVEQALQRWQDVDPENPRVYMLQIPYLLSEKKFDAVVSAANRALALAPEQGPDILSSLSRALTKHSQTQQSLDVLQALTWYQQKKPEAWLAYARTAAYYGQFNTALAHVNQILKQQPDNEPALLLKASLLQQTGKTNAAISLLKQHIAHTQVSDDLRFAYAKLLGESGQYAQARKILTELNTRLPDNPDILFALGLLALDEKKPQQAKSYFNRLISMGDAAQQARYFMGLAEEMAQQTEKALIWFASVPASSSRFDAAQQHYITLLSESGQLEKARLHLKLLRHEHPDKAVHYALMEAQLLSKQGQKQAALALYSKMLKSHPDDIELRYGRAMVAESLNQLALFEQDMRTILQQQPNNAIVLNALGYTLADRTNRYDEAKDLIQRALKLAPDDAYYLDSLGWLYYKMGKIDKALHYLERAVTLKKDAELMAHWGEVLWISGEPRRAKQVWQQAKELEPDNPLLLKTMHRFGQ